VILADAPFEVEEPPVSDRGDILSRRPKNMLPGALLGALLLTLGNPSWAAGAKDKEATDLATQAIMTDYLAMQFDPAVAKLQKAIGLCGKDKCSPRVLANLHRDLAVIYIAGQNKLEEGKAELLLALAADPAVELDKDLATPEVQAAFKAAKEGGGGEAAPSEPEKPEKQAKPKGKGRGGEAEPPPEAASSGDLIHQPPVEGVIQTPLPVYAELAPGVTADRLQVSFKTPTGDWLSAPMQPLGTGYGGEIPCTGVGSSPRELQYLIQAYQGSDVAAFSGSRSAPHRVSVKSKLEGEPPALPGKPPPAQCVEECPPGLPGCQTGEGADCQTDEDCSKGLVCRDEACKSVVVDPRQGPGKRLWASLGFQLDFMLFPAEKNVCSGYNEYRCFWGEGVEYLADPDADEGAGNEIASTGFKPATMRILLGGDYLLTPNISLGGRVGFAFNGGPRDFMPLHLEARGAYWFLPRTAARGFRPYVALSAGLAQVNGRIAVNARQSTDQDLYEVPSDEDPSVMVTKSRSPHFGPSWLDAWRAGGLMFVGLGGGAMYQIDHRLGAYLELKLAQMFSTSSATAALHAGASMGF
jgi:hypothetical protein